LAGKKDISKKQFESYERNHSGDNFQEMELGKIKKEKETVKRLRKKTQKKLKNIDLNHMSDSELEEISSMEHVAKKTRKNMKTHKKRFNSLSENEEFK